MTDDWKPPPISQSEEKFRRINMHSKECDFASLPVNVLRQTVLKQEALNRG